MPDEMTTLLARTWNSNESGLLWEGIWFEDEDGFACQTIASGCFVGPRRFSSESEFWSTFEEESQRFHGAKT